MTPNNKTPVKLETAFKKIWKYNFETDKKYILFFSCLPLQKVPNSECHVNFSVSKLKVYIYVHTTFLSSNNTNSLGTELVFL